MHYREHIPTESFMENERPHMSTHVQTVPDFTGRAAEALNVYYASLRPPAKSAKEKINALAANMGRFEFSAYGGGETEEMCLRAAERVYLFNQGIDIE